MRQADVCCAESKQDGHRHRTRGRWGPVAGDRGFTHVRSLSTHQDGGAQLGLAAADRGDAGAPGDVASADAPALRGACGH